jgi:hypothetical protein
MNVSHGRYPTAGMAGAYGMAGGLRARGRALPIVVASGLALGVFAGLLVVYGTGQVLDEEAQGVTPHDTLSRPSGKAGEGAAVPPAAAPHLPRAPGAEPAAPPEPVSPAELGSRAAASEKGPPAPPSVAVVSFTVKPRRARIFVNGAELAGTSTDVPLSRGSARIDVVIRSNGHRSHRESYTVSGDKTIEVALRKRERDEPSGPGSMLDIR